MTGTFVVVFTEDGVWKVDEKDDSFLSQWGPQVFEVFAMWLIDNHPDDAAIITSDRDVDPEILRLYEENTTRFVDAQQSQ